MYFRSHHVLSRLQPKSSWRWNNTGRKKLK